MGNKTTIPPTVSTRLLDSLHAARPSLRPAKKSLVPDSEDLLLAPAESEAVLPDANPIMLAQAPAAAGDAPPAAAGTVATGEAATATAAAAGGINPLLIAIGALGVAAAAGGGGGGGGTPADTTAPAAPANLALAAASDSGADNADRITNDTTPTITGTAEAGSTVTLRNGDTVLGTTTAAANGAWSITSAALADGVHNLTATARDAAGNTSVASTALTLTIDASEAAPANLTLDAASDSGPADGVTNDTTPTINGTAEAGSTVTLRNGATLLGTATAGADGSWSITSAALADGVHTLTASARDSAGNDSAASAPLSITVDTQAVAQDGYLRGAAIHLDANANGALDAGEIQVATTDAAGNFNLSADQNPSNLPLLAVGGINIDTGIPNTIVYSAPAGASIISPLSTLVRQLGDAAQVAAALGLDPALDLTNYDPLAVLESTPGDTTALAVLQVAAQIATTLELVRAAEDAAAADQALENLAGLIEAHAAGTDPLDLADADVLADILTGGLVEASVSDAITTANQALGDAGSQEAVSDAQLEALRLAPAPASSLDLLADTDYGAFNDDNLTRIPDVGDAPTLRVTFNSLWQADQAVVEGDTLTLLNAGIATVIQHVVTLADLDRDSDGLRDGAVSYVDLNLASLGAGTHNLSVRISTSAGAFEAPTASLSVVIDNSVLAPTDLDLHSASDSGASNSDDLTNALTPTLSGSGEIDAYIEIFSDLNGLIGDTWVDSDGNWSLSTGFLSEGAHAITARQTDLAGNLSAASPPLTLKIDRTALPPDHLDLHAFSDSGASSSDNLTNAAALPLSGVGEIGADVEVISDLDGLIGTAIVDIDGNWSLTTPLLSEGQHNITANQTDLAGNVSAASAPMSVRIDRTALAPTSLDLDAGSDSGASDSDNLTHALTPSLAGFGEIGASVEVTSNLDGLIGTATVGPDGLWSLSSAALSEGEHTITAIQTDLAGNVSTTSSTLDLHIDRSVLPPADLDLDSASDSGASDSDDLTNLLTPTLSGAGEAGATVTLISDLDGEIGQTMVDINGHWSLAASFQSEGNHAITASQTDLAGNVSGPSTTLNLVIDTHSALFGPFLDAGSDSGADNADRITSHSSPILFGTVEPGAQVAILENGLPLASLPAGPDGQWSIQVGPLAEGPHTLVALATDRAGNHSSASIELLIDTDAPTLSALQLAPESDSGAAGDHLSNIASPSLAFSAEAGAALSIDSGNGVFLPAGTATGLPQTLFASPTGDGLHEIRIQATDTAGNQSIQSLLYSLDATAPASVGEILDVQDDLAPVQGTVVSGAFSNDNTLQLSGELNIALGADEVLVVYAGGNRLGEALVTASDWSFTTPVLADGPHSFQVRAEDAAGNPGAWSAAWVVQVSSATPAAVNITSLGDNVAAGIGNLINGGLGNDATPILGGPILGAVHVGDVLAVYNGVTRLGEANITGASWNFTPAALADGDHTFTARMENAGGNLGAYSDEWVYQLDTQAPDAPSAPSLSPASDSGVIGDFSTSNTTPILTGSAPIGATVFLYEGAVLRGSAAADATGQWSITSAALANGPHILHAIARDAAGNDSAVSGLVTLSIDTAVDLTPPALSDLALDPNSDTGLFGDGISKHASPGILLTAEAGALLEIDIGNGFVAVGTGTGAAQVVHTPAYASGGVHSLAVRAGDPAGNQTEKTLTVNLDLTPPAAGAQLQGDAAKTAAEATSSAGVLTFTAEAGSTVLVNFQGAGGGALQKTYVATGLNQSSVLTNTNLNTLGNGLIQASVTAIDVAGNLAPAIPLQFTLDSVAPATPGLTLANDTGTPGDGVSSDGRILISALEAGAAWQYSLDAGANWLNGTGTSLVLLSGTYAQGQVRARQTDAAGNQSAAGLLAAVEISYATNAPTTLASVTQAEDDQALNLGVVAHNGISNDASLLLTGTLSAPLLSGETVRVYDGAALLGAAAVVGQDWSFQTVDLVNGDHAFSARVANADGLTGPAGAAYNVMVDTVAPALSEFTLHPDSDSGVAGDNRSNDATPTIQFTAEAGAVLAIDMGSGFADVGVGAGAPQTLTAPAGSFPHDGVYNVQLRATDAAGNQTTRSASFTLDTTLAAPTLALTQDTGAPADDRITSNAGMTFSTPAGDVTRSFSVDGGAASATYTAPTTEGAHSVQVTDTDTAGNTASASLSFTLDTQIAAPTLALSNDTGVSDSDRITSNAGMTFSTPAGDVTRSFSVDGGAASATYTAPTTEGAHSVQVTDTDIAGNTASASLSFTLDTQVNVLGIQLASDSGEFADDLLTNDATVQVSGQEAGGFWEYSVDGGGTWNPGQESGFELTERYFDDHEVQVRQTDVAGNTSGAAQLGPVRVDLTAPQVTEAWVDGNQLGLTFNQGMDATHRPQANQFTVVSGGNTLTVLSVAINGTEVLLTLSGSVQHGDDVTLSYTDVSAADDAATLQDQAGNDGANLASIPVDNFTDNLAPEFDNLSGAAAYTEDSPPIRLDADVFVTDSEMAALNGGLGDYDGASLRIRREGGGDDDDLFSFVSDGDILFTANSGKLFSSGQAFADYRIDDGVLDIDFTSQATIATQALVNNVLRHIGYANRSDNPPASVHLDWSFSDGDQEALNTKTVTLTAANDAPTAETGFAGLIEDIPHVFTAADFRFSDPDAGDSLVAVHIVSLPDTGLLLLNGSNVLDDQSINVADINAGRLTYQPPANGSGATAFEFQVYDGQFFSQEGYVFNIYIDAVNDAPSLITNTGLSMDQGEVAVINATRLAGQDIDDSTHELFYTLTTAPSAGDLWLDANDNNTRDSDETLGQNDSFGQYDVDTGRLHYQHGGGVETTDGFDFQLADGGEDGVAPINGHFSIAIDRPPVLTNWVVNDDLITLTYDGTLDAAHQPSSSYFLATVNGANRGIDHLSVQDNQVLVHLGIPVSPGSVVNLTYADPSGGDDAYAIQGADGRDVAGFSNLLLTNLTTDSASFTQAFNATFAGGSNSISYRTNEALQATGSTGLALYKNGTGGNILSSASISGDTLTLTTTVNLASTDHVLLVYDGTGDLRDMQGNLVPAHTLVIDGSSGNSLDLSGYNSPTSPLFVRGNNGDDTILGSAGEDLILGNGGADTLNGGPGADNIRLTEGSTRASDTVVTALADGNSGSQPDLYDRVFMFDVSQIEGINNDKLQLPSSAIAEDTDVNGADVGQLAGHHIQEGILSFRDSNDEQDQLINAGNLDDAIEYLYLNLYQTGRTIGFGYDYDGNGQHDSLFVFQRGSNDANDRSRDTLVLLVGVNGVTLGDLAGQNVVQLVDAGGPDLIGGRFTSAGDNDSVTLEFNEEIGGLSIVPGPLLMLMRGNGSTLSPMAFTGGSASGNEVVLHTETALFPNDYVLLLEPFPGASTVTDLVGNSASILESDEPGFALGGSANTVIDLSLFALALDIYDTDGGFDTLTGTSVTNLILAGPGTDEIYGGGGDDRLNGGLGKDRINGGTGADAYTFQQGDSPSVVYADQGTTGFGSGDTYTVGSGMDVIFSGFTTAAATADAADHVLLLSGASGLGMTHQSGLPGDQRYTLISGLYDDGIFTQNENGLDTLVLYDGDSNPGAVSLTGAVLLGIPLANLQDNGQGTIHLSNPLAISATDYDFSGVLPDQFELTGKTNASVVSEQAGGVLRFHTNGVSAGEDGVDTLHTFTDATPSYNQSWAVEIDAMIPAGLSDTPQAYDTYLEAGLIVSFTAADGTLYGLSSGLGLGDTTQGNRRYISEYGITPVASEWTEHLNDQGNRPTSDPSGRIGIRFDATSKVLTAYNMQEVLLSLDLDAVGIGNWGMTSADQFQIGIGFTTAGWHLTDASTPSLDNFYFGAPLNHAPVITSPASYQIAENSTAVATITATDPEADTLQYSISGGADASLFGIHSSTGALYFLVAPDFENPQDINDDNVYDVIVQVSDGASVDTQAIAVQVTDVTEDTSGPVITNIAITSDPGLDETYAVGDAITVRVTFDEVATPVGLALNLDLTIGGVVRQADYQVGPSSTTLNFAYTVQAGDLDANGVSIAANAITAIGYVQDELGNHAPLTHAALSDQAGHRVVLDAVNDAPVFSAGDGMTTLNFGHNDADAYTVATQADGKILVAGSVSLSGTDQFVLARYNADGSLDTSFDGDGWVSTSLNGGPDAAHDLLVQGDKIVLVGEAWDATNYDLGMVRYNADGSLDTNFGAGGMQWTGGSVQDRGWAVAQDANGKILLAGSTINANLDFSLVRYNSNGSVDNSFAGGQLLTDFGYGADVANDVLVQSDGKILLAGTATSSAGFNEFALARLNSNGTLDTTFGVNGKVILDIGGDHSYGESVALDSSGNILIGGYYWSAGDYNFALARLTANGVLDASFGLNGVVVTEFAGGDDHAYEVLVQADGKILLAGSADAGSNNHRFALTRYNADGSLDETFADAGRLLVAPDGNAAVGRGAALAADGDILITGRVTSNDGGADIGLVRVNPDGSLDRTFGVDTTLNNIVTYGIGRPAMALEPSLSIHDPELAALDSYAGASLSVSSYNGQNVLVGSGNLAFSSGNVLLSGLDIGDYSESPYQLDITFGANATQARVNETLASIAYHFTGAGSYTDYISWAFSDGNSGVQGSGGAIYDSGETVVEVVDLDGPTVTSLAITSDPGVDQTYGIGDVVTVQATFSEVLTVISNGLHVELNIGGVPRQAHFLMASGPTLVFSYTIEGYDDDANGISIDANSIHLTDALVRDAAGNNADLSHAALSDNALHKVAHVSVNLGFVAAGNGGFAIDGEDAGDRAGYSVSGAGDVNGDGLDDLLIGAPFNDDNASDAGRTYVVFGKTDVMPINLDDVSVGAGGFAIDGYVENAWAGYSVSAAGDVNGDGLADLLIGAPDAGGKAFVVFGKVNTGSIDLRDVASGSSGGFAMVAEGSDIWIGSSVSGAGDVNGDGLDDLLVNAPHHDSNAGRAYVVFGKSDFNAVGLDSIASGSGNGFAITTSAAPSQLGFAVSRLGDVNGDGLADLLVSAPNTAGDTGRVHVVFGKMGATSVDVDSTFAGFSITGLGSGSLAGLVVAAAGDVNGDGFADILVGENSTTSVYVVFGSDLVTSVNLSGISGGAGGYVIDDHGYGIASLAFAGDVNGDGLADLLVGTDSNSAYLVYGKTDLDSINLAQVAAGLGGFALYGTGDDLAGSSVSAAGDVNGDGYADLLIGAPDNDSQGTDAGRSYVVFGGPHLVGPADLSGDSGANALSGSAAAERLIGGAGNDTFYGGGGADVMYGGSGDDGFVLYNESLAPFLITPSNGIRSRIDGGSGIDTLLLGSNNGYTYDLTQIEDPLLGSRLESIEYINLDTGYGHQTLIISSQNVISMAGMNVFNSGNGWSGLGAEVNKHQMVVDGEAGDTVHVHGNFQNVGTASQGGRDFVILYDGSTRAELLVLDTLDIQLHGMPHLVSASVSGNEITLTFDREMQSGSLPSASYFNVLVNDDLRAIDYLSASGNDVHLILASSVAAGDTVALDYFDPSAGNDVHALQSVDGYDLATLNVGVNVLAGGAGAPELLGARIYPGANDTAIHFTFNEDIVDAAGNSAFEIELSENGVDSASHTPILSEATLVLVTPETSDLDDYYLANFPGNLDLRDAANVPYGSVPRNILIDSNSDLSFDYGADPASPIPVSMFGNGGADTLIGSDQSNDYLQGGEGADDLNSGRGADVIDLIESTRQTDTVRVTLEHGISGSNPDFYDTVYGFDVSQPAGGNDKLSLSSRILAADTSSGDGTDVGVIAKHTIHNGIIEFCDASDAPLVINSTTLLGQAANYLHGILSAGLTAGFAYDSDAEGSNDGLFVFQHGGGAQQADTLIYLAGISGVTLGNSAGQNVVQIVDDTGPALLNIRSSGQQIFFDYAEPLNLVGLLGFDPVYVNDNGTMFTSTNQPATFSGTTGTLNISDVAGLNLGPQDYVVVPFSFIAQDTDGNNSVLSTGNYVAFGNSGNTTMNLAGFGAVAPIGVDLIDREGGNDTLIGNDADNRIEGGAGADTLTGNDGLDTFAFNQGDSPVVTFNDLDSNGMDEHDTFSFAGSSADFITDLISGDKIDLNLPYLPGQDGGFMGTAPSNAQVADQSFYLVRGDYFNGDFFLDDSSAFTLVVYDGNPNAGEVLQTGLVINGWVPDDLLTYIGSGMILTPTL